MISCREFQSMQSIWKECTPMLSSYASRVVKFGKRYSEPITYISNSPQEAALIAESGFYLASQMKDNTHFSPKKALSITNIKMISLPGYQPISDYFLNKYTDNTISIANNLIKYLLHKNNISFHPQISGCGIVDKTECDIIADNELIEVKSIQTVFPLLSIKQLFTYATLLYASNYPINTITLLNPRLGTYYSETLESFSYHISGNNAEILLYQLEQKMIELQTSA